MQVNDLIAAEKDRPTLVSGFPARHHGYKVQCDRCLKIIEPGETFHIIRRTVDYREIDYVGFYCPDCIGKRR